MAQNNGVPGEGVTPLVGGLPVTEANPLPVSPGLFNGQTFQTFHVMAPALVTTTLVPAVPGQTVYLVSFNIVPTDTPFVARGTLQDTTAALTVFSFASSNCVLPWFISNEIVQRIAQLPVGTGLDYVETANQPTFLIGGYYQF
jgi:hypothetical protein